MDSCLLVDGPGHSGLVNVSWVCVDKRWLPLEDTANDSSAPCIYLFDQQFNRPMICSSVELSIAFFIFAAAIATNLIALHRFYSQNIRPEFLLLVFTVTVSNCLLSAIGLIGGLSKFYVDWYLSGSAGCSLVIGSRFALITIINWILALASVERRRTIFEQCKLASLSSASADQESKPGISWCSLSVIVMVLMILNTLMWSYPFIYLGAARALPAFVKGVRSGLAPVLVCGLMSIPSQIHHVAYKYVLIVVSTFVPVVVNLVSYARVWVIVRAYRLSRKFEVTTANKKCFDANRHARLAFEREVHAAKLTAGCVIFFFVFNAPAYVVMFLVLMMRFDADLVKTHVPLLLPSAFNSIMLLGPLLNPFVPSLFASMKRAHRHAKFAKEDTVIAMSVRPNNLIHPIIHITPAPPV